MTIQPYQEAASYLQSRLPRQPLVAVVLGSGLGEIADGMPGAVRIPYADIPNFPRSTVPLHKGELIYAEVEGVPALFMSGRFHWYEGYSMRECAFHVGVFHLMGIRNLILTNASGGINASYQPGDLVAVTDHIKLSPDSPVRGENLPEMGERFFDMSSSYSPTMLALAEECAREQGVELKKGVYAYMAGPQYETPAEIRALRILGADLVGMSTVAEVIQAAQCGMQTLCISCVSNYAAGIAKAPITHEEVCEAGRLARDSFGGLIRKIIGKIDG